MSPSSEIPPRQVRCHCGPDSDAFSVGFFGGPGTGVARLASSLGASIGVRTNPSVRSHLSRPSSAFLVVGAIGWGHGSVVGRGSKKAAGPKGWTMPTTPSQDTAQQRLSGDMCRLAKTIPPKGRSNDIWKRRLVPVFSSDACSGGLHADSTPTPSAAQPTPRPAPPTSWPAPPTPRAALPPPSGSPLTLWPAKSTPWAGLPAPRNYPPTP